MNHSALDSSRYRALLSHGQYLTISFPHVTIIINHTVESHSYSFSCSVLFYFEQKALIVWTDLHISHWQGQSESDILSNFNEVQ